MEEIGSAKASINRSKGLGENDPDHDVAHNHEPGDAPSHSRYAGGTPSAPRSASICCWAMTFRAGSSIYLNSAASISTWPTYPREGKA